MVCPHQGTTTRFFLIAFVAALTTSCSVEAVPSDGYALVTHAADAGTWEAQSEEAGGDGQSSEADDDSRFLLPHAIPPERTILEPVDADALLVRLPKPFYVPQGPPYGH